MNQTKKEDYNINSAKLKKRSEVNKQTKKERLWPNQPWEKEERRIYETSIWGFSFLLDRTLIRLKAVAFDDDQASFISLSLFPPSPPRTILPLFPQLCLPIRRRLAPPLPDLQNPSDPSVNLSSFWSSLTLIIFAKSILFVSASCVEKVRIFRHVYELESSSRWCLVLADSKFTQQELPACKPILTPGWVYSFFLFFEKHFKTVSFFF